MKPAISRGIAMIDLEKALHRCINPTDIREHLTKPFGASVGGRSFRVGANGHILFAIESGDCSVKSDCEPYLQKTKNIIERHLSKPTMLASRDALIEWAGKPYRLPCEKCEDGIRVNDECHECGGYGYINHNIVQIGIASTPVEIDAHLVGGMFDMLPGEQIGIIYSSADDIGFVREVSFSGPGWLMIVACLRKYDDTQPVRMLEVSHDIG